MREGRNLLAAGFTGSGKSAWVIQQVHSARHLLVWDSLQEWTRKGLVEPVYRIPDLKARLIENMRAPRNALRIGYAGPQSFSFASGKEYPLFPVFCRLAWVWMRTRQHQGAPGRTLVVEELADVTTPGKAPAAWGEILRKGRHYAAEVYATTQRPAESDKTIVSNAALIHSGFMAYPRDRTYMAELLGVPVAEVERLKPLDWIERNTRTGQLSKGRLTFR